MAGSASKNNATAEVSGLARKPRQQRSRVRFASLLDATDKLLETGDITNVGLYDIAKQAKVPPASVYHFLPSKEAAFLALASRYLEELNDATTRQPFLLGSVRQWPDYFIRSIERTAKFFNERPVMMKLLLSGAVNADIRKHDIEYTRTISEHGYDWMNRYFSMPYLPEPGQKFAAIWAIFDGIAMMSYGRHGCITDKYLIEIETAVIAYCRTFLPEVIPLRGPEEARHGTLAEAADQSD